MADETAPSDGVRRLAHDLRSPLTVVLGFCELLDDDEISVEEAREHARRISRAAAEMSALLDAATGR